jgi:hypothetical protein
MLESREVSLLARVTRSEPPYQDSAPGIRIMSESPEVNLLNRTQHQAPGSFSSHRRRTSLLGTRILHESPGVNPHSGHVDWELGTSDFDQGHGRVARIIELVTSLGSWHLDLVNRVTCTGSPNFYPRSKNSYKDLALVTSTRVMHKLLDLVTCTRT